MENIRQKLKNYRIIFLTGTGTDVGKTFISAAIMQGSLEAADKWAYWKPVQTGPRDQDFETVRSQLTKPFKYASTLYNYKKPASPDQAAKEEGLAAPQLKDLSQKLLEQVSAAPDYTWIIEGAGGLMVPLNEQCETWLDWIEQIEMPVLVVALSGLGTLNHTSMTIQMLHQRNIKPLGIILNGPLHHENESTLHRWYPDINFSSMPKLEHTESSPTWIHQSKKLFSDVQRWYDEKRTHPKAVWPELDRKYCWHPYTQHKVAPPPIMIKRAKGVWLETIEGDSLVDATSSWWTNTIGHGHPKIREALAQQHSKIDHIIFAGASHEPASRLSEQLCKLTKGKLSRVFYTDNGSCAVEVAIKMALQSAMHEGQTKRRKILGFHGSYHGDTFGTMAVAVADEFHRNFRDLMFQPLIATPATVHPCQYNPEGQGSLDQRIFELNEIFKLHHEELSCALIEPMLQGASGMNVQDPVWLRELSRLCKQYQIPLILDEVFTGMGRGGDTFVFLREDLDPDIVCIAKGLTGGNLPLAATMVKEEIFEAFYSEDRSKALLHGHTYTANALGCASALATLQIYEDEQLVKRSQWIEQELRKWIDEQSEALEIQNGRVYGAVMAWELSGTKPGHYFHPQSLKIPEIARREGLLLRPLGNTIYFVPPLSIQADELHFALSAFERLIKALRHPK